MLSLTASFRQLCILPNYPNRSNTVATANLLLFGVRMSARSRDTHLVDTISSLWDLGRYRSFKAEAILSEFNGLDDFSYEHLVAGFHVDGNHVFHYIR